MLATTGGIDGLEWQNRSATSLAFCTLLFRSFSRTSREYSWRTFPPTHCLHNSCAIVVFPIPGAPCTTTHLAREPSSRPTSLSSSGCFSFRTSSTLPCIVNLFTLDLLPLSFLTTAKFINFVDVQCFLLSSSVRTRWVYCDLRWSTNVIKQGSLLPAEGAVTGAVAESVPSSERKKYTLTPAVYNQWTRPVY